MDNYTSYKYSVQEGWRPLVALARRLFAWRYARDLALAVLDMLGEGAACPRLERMPDPARHPECWFRLV